MANIEFNGEEVEIPSFGVYLFEQAKKEAYNQALDDVLEKYHKCNCTECNSYTDCTKQIVKELKGE